MSNNEPHIGQWYQDSRERMFEVVAFDEDSVEIQFYDGDVAEHDMDSWYLLSPVPIPEPGDASGQYDQPDLDDFGGIDGLQTEDWPDTLDNF